MARTSVNEPQQRRSRVSLERVTRAGLALLDSGDADFTIGEVSRRSGVSVGAIYGRFGNKEGLVHHLLAEACAVIERELAEALHPDRYADLDTASLIATAVESTIRIVDRHAGVLQVVSWGSVKGERIGATAAELNAVTTRLLTQLLLTRRDDYPHDDADEAVRVAYHLALDPVTLRVLYGRGFAGVERIDRSQFYREVGRACAAYLLRP